VFKRKRMLQMSLFGLLGIFSASVQAQIPDQANSEDSSPYRLLDEHERPRSYILMPLASGFLPGLDQWIEGQYGYASFYTSYTILGLHLNQRKGATSGFEEFNEDRFLGFSMIKAGIGMSTYHSFRSAVTTHRPLGAFTFLTAEDSPKDIAMAPFRYEFLSRPTTWGWLLGVSALFVAIERYDDELPENSRRVITGKDGLYSYGTAFNTAVGEEAFFRGYLLPVLQQETGSPMIANIGQATIFTLGHSGGNKLLALPLGLVTGYANQKSGGSIAEGIFMHTWGNFIGQLYNYYRLRLKNDPNAATLPMLFEFPTFYF
jgi:membrane protease YdiL (CAAX protease family)